MGIYLYKGWRCVFFPAGMSCSSPLHATEITFSVQASWPLNSCFIEACSMAYSARGWVSADVNCKTWEVFCLWMFSSFVLHCGWIWQLRRKDAGVRSVSSPVFQVRHNCQSSRVWVTVGSKRIQSSHQCCPLKKSSAWQSEATMSLNLSQGLELRILCWMVWVWLHLFHLFFESTLSVF